MSYKPTDFFVGIVELFSVFLPGALLLALFFTSATSVFERLFPGLEGEGPRWIAFLIAAYFLGHLLKHFSTNLLNKKIYRRFYGKELKELEHNAEDLAPKSGPIDQFQWVRSYVRLENPAAAHEVEQYEADSKFFRSLSLVFVAAMGFAVVEREPLVTMALAVLASFSLWRFCRLRYTEAVTAYGYFDVIVKGSQKEESAPLLNGDR